jgi:predicted nuclease of predicted toxin-antitoxin system
VRLLIDQDLSGGTAAMLRGLGHDAVNAREIGMDRSPDPLLIQFAIDHHRIVATLDSDYPRLVATNRMSRPSIIFLRVQCPTSKTASDLIDKVCLLYEDKLLAGCLLTCTLKSVRLRSLPIAR